MNLAFFNVSEKRLAENAQVTSCKHTIAENEDSCTIIGYGIPDDAETFGFFDREGEFQLFAEQTRQENQITGEVQVYGENAVVELIGEQPIRDIRPTNTTAGNALRQALSGTRWKAGNVIDTETRSTRWFYISPYAALKDIEAVWGVRCVPRYIVGTSGIVERLIDIVSQTPVWRGKRFEIDRDLLTAMTEKDRRNVVTAIVGRGKGEATGDGYGRRIDFSDVTWSRSNGDPADKPQGQDYIEDPEATALYGIGGKRARFAVVNFDDVEDPAELLRLSYETLQKYSIPILSGKMSASAMNEIGFPHYIARYGEAVAFVAGRLRARSQIVKVVREYAATNSDQIEFGAITRTLSGRLASVEGRLDGVSVKAEAGAEIVKKNETLIDGYIDTMKTQILSSGTSISTDPADGGLVLTSDNGHAAVKITGSGILISNEKDIAGAWKWELAMNGDGLVADSVTTGVLKTAAVTILGTDRFFWDSASICAIDPDDSNRQIRFGLYDGQNYGIGYTLDGGATWRSAIDFDGVKFAAGTVSYESMSADFREKFDAAIQDIGENAEKALAAQTAADAAQAAADAAAAQASGLESRVTSVESKISPEAIVDSIITVEKYKENVTQIAAEQAQTAKDAADQAAADAAEAAGIASEKGRVWFQTTAPTGSEQDLWIDTTGGANTPKRWDGTAWVAVTDQTAIDAANKAASAQAAADAAQAAADAAAAQASGLESRVTSVESKISPEAIVDSIITVEKYKENVTQIAAEQAQTAKDAADQAAADAAEAAGIASEKGRVWFQTTAPTGSEQDLWIDTTGGANTPKRWDGTAWVAVTDQTAIDAANKAASAQAAADAAQATAGAAQDKANALESRVASAESKITPEAIVNTVRESVTYQSDFDGGENLLRNGDFTNGFAYWYPTNWSDSTEYYSYIHPKGTAWEWADESVYTAYATCTGTTGNFGFMTEGTRVQPGKTYTVSAYVAGHRIGTAAIFVYNIDSGELQEVTHADYQIGAGGNRLASYTKIKLTFQTPNCSTIRIYFLANSTEEAASVAASYLWITQVKLEEGTKATSFSPNPEDVYEKISSAVSQNASQWRAEFNRVGLAGAQTGITQIDETGLTVTHSNIGAYTKISADGMRLFDSTWRLLGGLFANGGRIYSGVQTLMNPAQPNFRVSVAPDDIGGEQSGLHFIINDQNVGIISAFHDGSSGGMRFDLSGQLGLYQGDLRINGRSGITIETGGDVTFYFMGYDYAGSYTQLHLTMSEIWYSVAKDLS